MDQLCTPINNCIEFDFMANLQNTEYNMCHEYRGMAIIINNEHFLDPSLKARDGTHVDKRELEKVLKQLGFEVKEYLDLCYTDIMSRMKRIALRDHSQCDCILVVILSHGKLGFIHARDTCYPLESILNLFSSKECPTLAGKPKLFFIQACQGVCKDPGFPVHTPDGIDESNNDDSHMGYRMPLHGDFLVAFATIPGFVSYRNSLDGSWFIESLCQELRSQGKSRDILTLLTFVAQRVSNYESNNEVFAHIHRKKQITCTMSTLTRMIYFRDKSDESD